MVKNTLILILPFLFLIGCGEEEKIPDTETIEATLQVAPTVLSFSEEGGNASIAIESNSTWRIEYNTSLWARPSIQTTKGNATITITADENPSTEQRSMTMNVTVEGIDDIEITINQKEREPDPVEPEKPDSIDPDDTGMRDLTSVELSQLMGVGWNLGNSLEAISVNGDILSGGESSWGNPVVTKTLIDGIKAAGFSTIRLPVSWSHKFDDQDTYKINWAWKQRVEEVVNYALDNDMYVMINIHWDGGWMNHPNYDQQDAINERLALMWQQIAVFFRDYDDRLLFAGTNEVHTENDFGTPTEEEYTVQNSFNQTFVNTVRATGGRNTFRHLVVQGYNTNIDHTRNFFTIPTDPTDDRLFVEVHFYDPYNFTLDEGESANPLWGADFSDRPNEIDNWGQEDWVDTVFGQMKSSFVDQGYPVILGEYGALLRESPSGATYEEHVQARNSYLHYTTKTAVQNGLIPVYWDNGPTGNNTFGLFNRQTGEQVHTDAIEAIITGGAD